MAVPGMNPGRRGGEDLEKLENEIDSFRSENSGGLPVAGQSGLSGFDDAVSFGIECHRHVGPMASRLHVRSLWHAHGAGTRGPHLRVGIWEAHDHHAGRASGYLPD